MNPIHINFKIYLKFTIQPSVLHAPSILTFVIS